MGNQPPLKHRLWSAPEGAVTGSKAQPQVLLLLPRHRPAARAEVLLAMHEGSPAPNCPKRHQKTQSLSAWYQTLSEKRLAQVRYNPTCSEL